MPRSSLYAGTTIEIQGRDTARQCMPRWVSCSASVTDPHCRICSGRLELKYPGRSEGADTDAFAPTNHRPGEHGDLWACRECGTVQQAELPEGEALHDLYRTMEDDAYLA